MTVSNNGVRLKMWMCAVIPPVCWTTPVSSLHLFRNIFTKYRQVLEGASRRAGSVWVVHTDKTEEVRETPVVLPLLYFFVSKMNYFPKKCVWTFFPPRQTDKNGRRTHVYMYLACLVAE